MSETKKCNDCPLLAVEGKSRCETCLKDRKLQGQQRKSLGLCSQCGSPADRSGSCCARCLANKKRWRDKTASLNLCRNCGSGPRFKNRIYCLGCLELTRSREKERYRIRLASGVCTNCGKTPADSGAICRTCQVKRLVRTHLGSSKLVQKLETMLQQQGGCCALTGLPLKLGENASIDHIIPRSKGGLDVIENLRWLDYRVNMSRRDLSDDEFFGMCQRVVDHAASKKRLRLIR